MGAGTRIDIKASKSVARAVIAEWPHLAGSPVHDAQNLDGNPRALSGDESNRRLHTPAGRYTYKRRISREARNAGCQMG